MKKKRVSDIITIVLFLSIIFGFAVAFVAVPDKSANSFETNLQMFPKANDESNDYMGADYLLHGELADDFNEYFCDQFPLRKQFVSLKALSELLSLRGVNNGVLYSHGRLATVLFNAVGTEGGTELYSEKHVNEMTKHLKNEIEKLDVPVKVMLPPRTIDVIAPEIGYPTQISDALNAQVKEALGEYFIDVLPVLRERLDEGYNVYYKTDHHWTATGAYFAYEKVLDSFGAAAEDGYALFESFDFRLASRDFKGTAYRNGNYFFLSGEEIQTVHYDGEENLKVELGKSLGSLLEKDGMYDFGALYSEDPYNVYLHGKTDYVRITDTKNTEKETLLVIKDSFAHSLVPFLAKDYNIVMVDLDLREASGVNLSRLISRTGADRVLILYNLQNLIENTNLALITAD